MEGAGIGGAIAKDRHGDGVGSLELRRIGETQRDRQRRADNAGRREALLGIERMHMPAPALAQACLLLEDFGHQAIGVDLFRQPMQMIAMGADQRILGAQPGRDARRDCLLADAGMQFAMDLPGRHAFQAGFLEMAHIEHRVI